MRTKLKQISYALTFALTKEVRAKMKIITELVDVNKNKKYNHKFAFLLGPI